MIDARQPARAHHAWQHFVETSLDALLAPGETADPAERALQLFQAAAREVPAYRALLAEAGIDPARIKDPHDFQHLPLLTKPNYVRRYPLAERVRGGRLEACDMIAVSSGSTGEPIFWPRFQSDEAAIAVRFEQVFADSFQADRRRTLALVCFALGSWVGGLYTLACCRLLAAKGYPILCVAPGNNKAEIWRVAKALAPGFDQTVLLGYPPFLKDVIDGGIAAGIDWRPWQVKLVMAGEVFSEEWRTLVGERLGVADFCYGQASLYGTADAGVLGNETPLSIAVRRFLAATPKAARELFGESRLPTLAQYDPMSRYFEVVEDGTLAVSGDNSAPLIRYHIADRGGLASYDHMLAFCRDHGFDPMAVLAHEGWRGARRLPFVHVFGRADFTVSYFGANIYPENLAVGLEQPGIREWVTGKFVLQAVEGLNAEPHLAVAVELAPGENTSEARQRAAERSILEQLLRLNSEFANYAPPERRDIRVRLLPTGEPDWFPVGVKHRYTRR